MLTSVELLLAHASKEIVLPRKFVISTSNYHCLDVFVWTCDVFVKRRVHFLFGLVMFLFEVVMYKWKEDFKFLYMNPMYMF